MSSVVIRAERSCQPNVSRVQPRGRFRVNSTLREQRHLHEALQRRATKAAASAATRSWTAATEHRGALLRDRDSERPTPRCSLFMPAGVSLSAEAPLFIQCEEHEYPSVLLQRGKHQPQTTSILRRVEKVHIRRALSAHVVECIRELAARSNRSFRAPQVSGFARSGTADPHVASLLRVN